MNNNFTSQARKVLNLAKEFAINFGHLHVGSEHLLLGFMNVKDSLAYKILTSRDIEEKEITDAVYDYMKFSKPLENFDDLVLTPRMSRIMQVSFKEAKRNRSKKAGSEHLLLSMLLEGDGVA